VAIEHAKEGLVAREEFGERIQKERLAKAPGTGEEVV